MSNKLKKLMTSYGVTQAACAAHLGVSSGTMADLVNHGKWPVKRADELRNTLALYLIAQGAATKVAYAAVQPTQTAPQAPQNKTPGAANTRRSAAKAGAKAIFPTEGADMLLAHVTLSPAAKQHFKLLRDPFIDDVASHEDVFLSPDVRRVREAMWHTVKHGGMLAVVGESGSGKTTLKRDLVDRIQREKANAVLIEPYVLAMEENDTKGRTLKSLAIAEAILRAIAPHETVKRGSEARFNQLHNALKSSYRAGNRHVLVIEEAHCLPTPTLKHLKRFYELEDGFKKLLSIILIGQPELRLKLSESNAEVREVVQRCAVVELMPLDNHLSDYLNFKLKRVGGELDKVFEHAALTALGTKLSFIPHGGRKGFGAAKAVSLLYPLAVHNLVSAALNDTARICAPRVTADIVMEA